MLYTQNNMLITFGTGKQVCRFPDLPLGFPPAEQGRKPAILYALVSSTKPHLTSQKFYGAAVGMLNAGMTQCCALYRGRTSRRNDDRSETSNGGISEVKVFCIPERSCFKTRGGGLQSKGILIESLLCCFELAYKVLHTGRGSSWEYCMDQNSRIKNTEAFLRIGFQVLCSA